MKPTYEELEIRLANAESKCRDLAAENAGLKQSKPSLKAMMSALDAFYADEDVPENAMLIAFNILRGDIKTPATDAFLAEVRSQGVEMFSSAQSKIADDEMVKGDCDLSLRYRAMSLAADNFAGKIRKGAVL
ncbi:hypothetical protein NK099_003511 [Salmonella enterica]|nr:hypothetical protein [Salmonella enterica]